MFRHFCAIAAMVVLWINPAGADDVSHQPPAVYAKRLAPLLTPLKEMLPHKEDMAAAHESEIGLLYETVRTVDDSGRNLTVLHQIDIACDEQGAAALARNVVPFRKADQKIHLVMARTIQPDGSTQDVAANAAFLQSPQHMADASLYSDYAELVVLFPNVKARSMREQIIVLEEPKSRIPGEFTAALHFATHEPQVRIRHVADLSAAMARRLVITPLGQETPAAQRQTTPDGREQFTWLRERAPKMIWEPVRAPSEQAGPTAFLTTIKDWDAFGDWYRTLLKGRDRAKSPLAEHVASKTKGLTGERNIINVLFTEAAREVRHTGLEFGLAGLQPYDPNDVWSNRYGDCKDKANLLRVMLREKNISAYLVFANTTHAGRIEKRSPDYRHFDHVFVAVALADGGYLFCDPTIKYGRPGMLRPDDADRDVLLLKDKNVEFAHTPAQDAGELNYNLDVKLGRDGSVSGWITLDGIGYQGASLADYLADQDREQARDRMLSLVHSFYRAGELIDLDLPSLANWNGTYRLRMYFVAGASGAADRTRDTLAFPLPNFLLPEFGDYRERRKRDTLYWQWRETKRLRAKFELPAGWAAIDPPRPFQVDCDAAGASAGWDAQGSTVTASFEFVPHQSNVAPEQYGLLYNAVTSLRLWAGRPLAIGAVSGPASTGPATRIAAPGQLGDFPLMPTGIGQLDLLDRRFPLDGNLDQRREALLKVLQWFPEDALARFVANMRLAEIDLKNDPRSSSAMERVRQLVAGARGQLSPAYVAWGEYLLGLWLVDAGQKAEAQTILERLASDKNLSALRRGWAAVESARILKDSDPAKGIAILDPTLSLDSTALPTQYVLLAELMLKTHRNDDLRQRLQSLAQRSAQQADGVFASMIGQTSQYASALGNASAADLLKMIEQIIGKTGDLAHLRRELAVAQARLGAVDTYNQIATDLGRYLKDHRPEWWDRFPLDASVVTRAQYLSAIQQSGSLLVVETWVKYTLEYLTRIPPQADDFGDRLWRIAAALHERNRDSALVEELLACLDRLPETEQWFGEGRLIRADRLHRAGKDAEALDLLRAVAGNANIMLAVRHGAYRRAGEVFEQQGKYADALAMYKNLEENISANRHTGDALLRAVFINLSQKNQDEALRLCGLLARLTNRELDSASCAAQIREMVLLSADPAAAKKFWKHQETWWHLWLDFVHQVRGSAATTQPQHFVVPVVTDIRALGAELGGAQRADDRERFLTAFGTFVSAARWEPQFVVETASIASYGTRMFPSQAASLREMTIVMLQDAPLSKAAQDQAARMWLAAHLLDAGRTMPALGAVRQYMAIYKEVDAVTVAMHRIWAIAAMRSGMGIEEVTAALEKDLPAFADPIDRARTVTALAQLYRARKRTQDEITLLRTELLNPNVLSDTARAEALRNEYQLLLKGRPATTRASLEVYAQWLKAHKPAWYDYAQPAKLEDLHATDLESMIRNPPANMLPAERFKMCMLVATSAGQKDELRERAFFKGSRELSEMCLRSDEYQAVQASIYESTQFDDTTRALCLGWAIGQGYMGHTDTTFLRQHPLCARCGFTPPMQQWLDGLRQWSAVDQDSPAAIRQYLADLISLPLGSMGIDRLNESFNRLLQLDVQMARDFYRSSDRLAFTAETADTPTAYRLRMLRLVRAAEGFADANRAARDLTLQYFDRRPVPPLPKDWRQYRDFNNLGLLGRQEALAIRLQLIRDRRFHPASDDIWRDLVRGADRSQIDLSFRRSLYETLLKRITSNELVQHLAIRGTAFFDVDDPAERKQLLELLKPLRDAQRYPLTSDAMIDFDLYLALRTGQNVDIDREFQRMKKPDASPSRRQKMQIVHFLRARNISSLKDYLQQLPAEKLLDHMCLDVTIPALAAAGMTDELDLARDAARKDLYRWVLSAWATPNGSCIMASLSLSRAVDDPNAIPQAWFESIQGRIKNRELLCEIQAESARLHHDWKRMLAMADELIQIRPKGYSYHWIKAQALVHLNRKTEAKPFLKAYVDHANDEPEWLAAAKLLAELN